MKTRLEIIGKDGNAFMILGLARRAAINANWSKEKIKEYTDKATDGDYNNLLRVTMEYFEVC